MKTVQFNARCSAQELKLFKAAAAKNGMSLNKFVCGSAKLLAVLGLHEEANELVSQRLAEKLGTLIERLDDEVGAAGRNKRAV